jgi:RNA polymerase subunit RPABC4/transcription elongation factor Spt4
MKTNKQKIIDEWQKKIVVHPSYGSIAKKVGVDKSYVFRIIKEYLKNKNGN